ncbi:MAG TPA: molybdopterin-guanine dinucleotide biosynthesis protein B [Anaerolineae bacterium]|nr:molybdopterin-guanine dinucleotide biosynthesis protein B [Anaerolineae bacterium]
MIPVVSIVGKSDAGKTTLLEKLIPELKRRGYRVATIKHDAHQFEIDHPGKDSYRHFHAGSDWTVIASSTQLASVRRLDRQLALDEIAATISGVDLILTEGFKREARVRIEVSRAAQSTELISTAAELLAIAADHPIDIGAPVYALDDAPGLVDLIERVVLRA